MDYLDYGRNAIETTVNIFSKAHNLEIIEEIDGPNTTFLIKGTSLIVFLCAEDKVWVIGREILHPGDYWTPPVTDFEDISEHNVKDIYGMSNSIGREIFSEILANEFNKAEEETMYELYQNNQMYY